MALAAMFGTPAGAETRIATVDMAKLFDGYYRTQQANTALQKVMNDLEQDHNKMVEELKKLQQEYEGALAGANDQAVSAEERGKRKQLAEDKLKQVRRSEGNLDDYRRTAQSTLTEQKRRAMEKVVEDIRVVVEAKAKAGGYTLVLDVSAVGGNGLPVVLYHGASDSDLTQAVLSDLNAAAPHEAAKPPKGQS
jgi:outer membrane protein